MKNLLICLFFMSQAFVAVAQQQDIVIKTRLDDQVSTSLIRRFRTFLINNHVGDPYSQTIQGPIRIELDRVMRELPEDTQKWLKDLQSKLNLSFLDSKYALRIDDLSYSIEGVDSDLKALSAGLDRVDYVAKNSVKGLKLRARNISFEVELKRARVSEPIRFELQLVQPEFIVDPELVMDLSLQWSSFLLPDALFISLHTIDLSAIFERVVKKPELINFTVTDMIMPEVSIRIEDRQITLDNEKIKRFLVDRRDELKMAILDLIKSRLSDKFANVIKDEPVDLFLNRTLRTTGDLVSVFDLKTLDADVNKQVLEARVGGYFCVGDKALEGYCATRILKSKPRRLISEEHFLQSMAEIDKRFADKVSNAAISISEHYINQLVDLAVQSNLLDLGDPRLRLGPKGAFVLAEQKGDGFSLYLDIITKLDRSQQILVGRSEIRFPVRLKIGLKVENYQDYPRLQIKVLALDTPDSLLLKGLPVYELATTVSEVRFRSKILKAIHQDLAAFNNKILVQVDLKEFKGTYLEDLSFYSDGLGRATAVLLMNGQKILR